MKMFQTLQILKMTEVQLIMSDFNQSRYLELLKYSQDLEKQGKSLYHENEKCYFELSKYRVAVSHHVDWTKRRELALLMENFLHGVIDVDHADQFCLDFFALRKKFMDSFKKFESELGSERLKDFQPDEKSIGFGWLRLLSFLWGVCDAFDDEFATDEETYEFCDSVKEAYFRLHPYLEAESDTLE